jgi:phosphoribosylanthranilate isomerase
MRVKICGITNRDDALYAAEAGADALGFNFAKEAKAKNRYIDPDKALRIVEQLPPMITVVGVTVNARIETLLDYLEIVDCVQFHGEEDPKLCQAFGNHGIKAFRLRDASDIKGMRAYDRVGAYLVDAHVANARGGTGHVADWSLAAQAKAIGKPIILAGGLTPENVADAIRAVQPYAVDTASSVESVPGKKDHERVKRFIHNAKTSLP